MSFDQWYVLLLITLLALLLGVDQVKPRAHLCAQCAREDKRQAELRIWLFSPFFLFGLTLIVSSLLPEEQVTPVAGILGAFWAACAIILSLLWLGRKIGTSFGKYIWRIG